MSIRLFVFVQELQLCFSTFHLSSPSHCSTCHVCSLHLKRNYTIYYFYLAPSVPVSKANLLDLFVQLSPSVVVLGDFNIRHPLWRETVISSNVNIFGGPLTAVLL